MTQLDYHDPQYSVLPDNSLLITSVGDHNGGKYNIMADNGIGEATSTDIEVVIYPILPAISMVNDKNIFMPNTDVTIECKIRGQLFKVQNPNIQLPNFLVRLPTTNCSVVQEASPPERVSLGE